MQPQSFGTQKPAVWNWYAAYCFAMALMYLLCVVMGFFFLFADPDKMEMDAGGAKVMGGTLIVLGLLLGALFGAGPLLPLKKWAWVVGIVLICIGLSSMCCLPASIPLLIWWLKPETKQYYNMS
jgi:hypothetical protein